MGDAFDPSSLLGGLLNFGVLGIVLVLMLVGWLVPKPAVTPIREDAQAWKRAYESERDAHQVTRDALGEASRRADVAVETARTANALLDKLQHSALGGRT